MAIILEDFIAGKRIHELRDYFDDRRMSRVEVWSELQAASEYVRKECARELMKRARSGEPEAIRLLGEGIMMACASESGDYETEAITPWAAFQMLRDSAELAKSQDRSEDQ